MTELAVAVEEIEERHILPYAELSAAEYGDAPISDPSHLAWKFLRNPQGPSIGIHLLDGDRIVGRLVAQPRIFVLPDGTQCTAAYFVDLLIHPNFRGMRSLIKLLSGIETMRSRFDVALVTPNAMGIQVWQNVVKMREWFQMAVFGAVMRAGNLAGVGSITSPIRRVMNSLSLFLARAASLAKSAVITLDQQWPDAQSMEDLLNSPAPTPRGLRSEAFLRWRFRESPIFKYELYFVRKKGKVVGYVATRRATLAGYSCRFIIDAFAAPDLTARDWRSVRSLLIAMEAGESGADAIVIIGRESFGPLRYLARFPFVRVPARVLPQRTPLFGEYWRERIDGLQDMELTLADCDMI